MINADAVLVEFIKYNWQTLTILFIIASAIVKVTPCKWDDILFSLIINPVVKEIKKYIPIKKDGSK